MYGKRKAKTSRTPSPKKVAKTVVKKAQLVNGNGHDADQNHEVFKMLPRSSQPDEYFTCEVCGSTFVTNMSLTRHMVFHEDAPTFPCSVCKKVFYQEDKLSQHKLSHQEAPAPKFSCSASACKKTFDQKEKLKEHFEAEHTVKPVPTFPCTLCKSTFLQKDQLTQHNARDHAQFICKYCGRDLTRRDLLLRHITNVHPEFLLEAMQNEAQVQVASDSVEKSEGRQGQSRFQQPLPEITLTPIYNTPAFVGSDYGEQYQQQEDEEDYDEEDDSVDMYLEEDEEDYDDVTKINASLNGIRVERKHQCPECGVSFMSRVNMQRHMSSHNSDRPHKCDMCGKGFVRKEHLTKHLSSVHSGVKYTCEFCGKDISRKDHLIRHIRNVHPAEYVEIPPEIVESQDFDVDMSTISRLQASGITISERALKSMQPRPKKPYLSCDLCDETFNHIDDLNEHQSEMHCDIRRFKCNFCPKAFKRREHLTKHEVLHTGEKNFCCDVCGRDFPRKDALQDHVRRIHGIEMTAGTEFPCNFCEKVFLSKSNLLRHLSSAHDLIVDLGEDEEVLDVVRERQEGNSTLQNYHSGETGIGVASYPVLSNYAASSQLQPQQGPSTALLVNPVAYNLNGNPNVSLSFCGDPSYMQDNLQGFSCAHCQAMFNDEKIFLIHLKSHRLK